MERYLGKTNPPQTYHHKGYSCGQITCREAKKIRKLDHHEINKQKYYAANIAIGESLRTDFVVLVSGTDDWQIGIVKHLTPIKADLCYPKG